MKIKLQILTSVYALIYVFFIGRSILISGFSFNNEAVGTYLLLVLFLIAFFLSWSVELLAGVMLLTWYAGIWILELFFVEHEQFFLIISGLPIIAIGTLFVLAGVEKSKGNILSVKEKWKTMLSTITITFTILYSMVIIEDVSNNLQFSYSRAPGIFLILLAAVYIVGFILSWKHELYAGIAFILWYIGVFVLFKSDLVISNYGPWNFAGFVVFLNGYLFIRFGYQKLKQKRIR